MKNKVKRKLFIRLMKTGKRWDSFYAIIVVHKGDPVKTRFIEKIGILDSSPKQDLCFMNMKRYSYWLNKGAKTSLGVSKLMQNLY